MTQYLRLACLIAMEFACQPEAQELPAKKTKGDMGQIEVGPDRNGTRLRVYNTFIGAEDGTRLTIPNGGFRDTKLDVDCSERMADDLKNRCLPFPSPQSNDVAVQYGNMYYSDYSCVRKAVAVTSCQKPPRFLLIPQEVNSSYCHSTTLYHVYTKLSVVRPAELWVYSSTGCAKVSQMETADLLNNYTFIDLMGAIRMNAEEFVAMSSQLVVQ